MDRNCQSDDCNNAFLLKANWIFDGLKINISNRKYNVIFIIPLKFAYSLQLRSTIIDTHSISQFYS